MAWKETEEQVLKNMVEEEVDQRFKYEMEFKRPWFNIVDHAKRMGIDLSFVKHEVPGMTTNEPKPKRKYTKHKNALSNYTNGSPTPTPLIPIPTFQDVEELLKLKQITVVPTNDGIKIRIDKEWEIRKETDSIWIHLKF